MEPFTRLTAIAAPLIRDNVDTDAIIPSREMTSVGKSGLAEGLFAGWRYRKSGSREPNPDFVLNDPAYAGARILLGGANFGCGSSREHAAWALAEYGFRAIIAPSFNPIFRGNCVRNGIVPAVLPADVIGRIAQLVMPDPERQRLTVDLNSQIIATPDGEIHEFPMDAEAKEMLLHGLDAIDLTLQRREEISAFVARDRSRRTWVYGVEAGR